MSLDQLMWSLKAKKSVSALCHTFIHSWLMWFLTLSISLQVNKIMYKSVTLNACVRKTVSYPLSLLPDPDALQQVIDDLGSVFAAVRGTTDVGNFIWTSPVIYKTQTFTSWMYCSCKILRQQMWKMYRMQPKLSQAPTLFELYPNSSIILDFFDHLSVAPNDHTDWVSRYRDLSG